MSKSISIVGGGLVGSMLACYLAKRGNKITVYERRPDMRLGIVDVGRSINLALSDRGWKSLDKIGLRDAVSKISIAMKGRMVHSVDGKTELFPYGKEGQAIYSVSRGELNRIMMNEAEKFPQVQFNFNHRCTDVDFDNNTVAFLDLKNNSTTTNHFDLLFGSDGAYSGVRYAMQKTPKFNVTQQHEPYGYKELEIPAGPNGHVLEKNALHIWPRKSFMMIALPNLDGSFTVTLFAPFKGENSFESITNATEYFKRNFPDALPLMPELEKDFAANPTSSLVTVKCFPWKYKNTCLLGDAAHAIVPFYGQGMNCGFEDVRVLDELLDDNESWETALTKFEYERKPNTDAIADLALHNYIEMRDLSGQKEFQLRQKIEKSIAEKYGEQFMTHYAMVTFSDLSYSEARRRGKEQDELLDTLISIPGIEQKLHTPQVTQTIESWINSHRN